MPASDGLMCGERFGSPVVYEFERAVRSFPVRATPDFESQFFVVTVAVLFFQLLPQRDFEPRTVAEFERVGVVTDNGVELPGVVFFPVAWRAGFVGDLVVFWVAVFAEELEEASPRLPVLSLELLGDAR